MLTLPILESQARFGSSNPIIVVQDINSEIILVHSVHIFASVHHC